MRPIFSRPYPLRDTDGLPWLSAFLLGAFVGIFILTFKPFGLSQVNPPTWFLLGYGAISTIVFLLYNALFPRLFPRFWKKEDWSIGREVIANLLLLSLIALGNHFYELSIFYLLDPRWAYEPNLPLALFNVVCLGIFPIFAFTMIKENQILRHNLKEAQHFNDQLRKRQQDKPSLPDKTVSNPEVLCIDSDNQHEILRLTLAELRYISSDANYIDVVWLKGEALQRSTLRSSLKRVTEDHEDHPYLMRCHRTYFVNLRSLQSVSGNSRGYKLKLRNVEEEIPVSRSYVPKLRSYLQDQSVPA